MAARKRPAKKVGRTVADPNGADAPERFDADQAPERFDADQLSRVTAPPELDKADKRARWKLEEGKHKRGPYLVELNVQYVGGLPGAATAFLKLYEEVCRRLCEADQIEMPDPPPIRIGKSYYRCELRVKEWRALIAEDEQNAITAAPGSSSGAAPSSPHRCIYKLWPDFPVTGHISRSVSTVKADAALRSFEASGEGVTWAVIDSGIDGEHLHFGVPGSADHTLLHASVRDLHRSFAPVPWKVEGVPMHLPNPDLDPQQVGTGTGVVQQELDRDAIVAKHREWALRDDYGHGSHVAGIIAGTAPLPAPASADGASPRTRVLVLQREDRINPDAADDDDARMRVTREREVDKREAARFHGVAPHARLVSLRVLDEKGEGRSSDVIRALEYVREVLNDNGKVLRVQGVNLSVGYEFDAEMFACGQSPLCSEVNRLVLAGVVVVTAAGNTGYGTINAVSRATKIGLSQTINDPGNADLAITVGATHRDSPHTYGVSYFSSKGPTGDGRLKPDLVAPGERIISCGAGNKLRRARAEANKGVGAPGVAPAAAAAGVDVAYVEDSGTSMAAPHVSGAVAAFLSVRREFIGRPLEVKKVFLDSAMPLGRERYFEGHGLLDLMKAVQSV